MKFVKDCADLDALLKEVMRREIHPSSPGRKELRLVMSRKTADAFSVDRRFLALAGENKPTIEPTIFGSYYVHGHQVDFNDGLPFGEVIFSEVFP